MVDLFSRIKLSKKSFAQGFFLGKVHMYEYSNMCVSYIKESNGKKRKRERIVKLHFVLLFFDLVFIQDTTLCRKIREALTPEIISSLNDLQPRSMI